MPIRVCSDVAANVNRASNDTLTQLRAILSDNAVSSNEVAALSAAIGRLTAIVQGAPALCHRRHGGIHDGAAERHRAARALSRGGLMIKKKHAVPRRAVAEV
jgi:hypothetical protein